MKLLTVNKELHPRGDVAPLFVSGENGGRELIGCKTGEEWRK